MDFKQFLEDFGFLLEVGSIIRPRPRDVQTMLGIQKEEAIMKAMEPVLNLTIEPAPEGQDKVQKIDGWIVVKNPNPQLKTRFGLPEEDKNKEPVEPIKPEPGTHRYEKKLKDYQKDYARFERELDVYTSGGKLSVEHRIPIQVKTSVARDEIIVETIGKEYEQFYKTTPLNEIRKLGKDYTGRSKYTFLLLRDGITMREVATNALKRFAENAINEFAKDPRYGVQTPNKGLFDPKTVYNAGKPGKFTTGNKIDIRAQYEPGNENKESYHKILVHIPISLLPGPIFKLNSSIVG